ncbi:hypothetical protein ALC53_13697 [Atta colombica]|uniref:CAP-Gly domain-containing protein n=1 Tax=Atta colombica TaxID=520822 RepID=A0A195AUH5_9HYME|nr:hypothetical protein ALC53_13697 [Atta colombica]
MSRLALENHVLRRKILRSCEFSCDAATSPPLQSRHVQLVEEVHMNELTSPEKTTMDVSKKIATDVQNSFNEPRFQHSNISTSNNNSPDPSSRVGQSDKFQDSLKCSKITVTKDIINTKITEAASAMLNVSHNENHKSPSTSIMNATNNEEESRVEISGNATNMGHLDIPGKDPEDLSLKYISDGDNSVFSDHVDQPQITRQGPGDSPRPNEHSENESEELDDIELIFTTDEICRDLGLQEDLVSITETETWQHGDGDQPILLKYVKPTEDESLVCNGEKTSSVEETISSQSSSIDREESVDRFDESSSTRLNKMWSQCSVLVETDISKCGILEDAESTAGSSLRHVTRRNTLAAPSMAYRPIIHREALANSRRKNSVPLRPVMDRSSGARRESGAQTDISALPAQWRSESYLAHKVAHTFTTLPSKFALPTGVSSRLRLSDKTREARRVMLSDISFTSMVPELSRSADHLCHEPHAQTCFSSRGCGLRTSEVHRRESLGSSAGYWLHCNPTTGLPSPCDCRLSTDLYSSRYRGSLTSIPSPNLEVVGGPRRHSWRATAASLDTWKVATSTPRPTWSSMPSSPTHVHPPSTFSKISKNTPKRTRSKVTFQECPLTRGSLPNLHSDSVGGENSGDSTESLIDEAEDYLRRSIDSMLTISSISTDYWNKQTTRRRRTRRHSEPNLIHDIPRDLKLDHLVKIISPEGRVLQGRVRYVGPVPGREDTHVGVELPYVNGSSDGTFHGRRFFDW